MSDNFSQVPRKKGRIIAHFGQHLIVEDGDGHFYHCQSKRSIGPLVTGDWVEWQALTHNTGVIHFLCERKSLISKFDRKLKNKPVIANVDQILVVVALKPKISHTTIDRYYVIAQHFGLAAILVVNKWDLKEDESFDDNLRMIQRYQAIFPNMLHISTKNREGMETLKSVLHDKCTLLAGQSGVGKSSIIREIIPDLKIRTGELSKHRNLGKHTTSASQLYHLPDGGNVIDSPGIRQFYLHHLEAEAIKSGFPEFAPFLGQCQFRNCQHQKEPGCAVKQAVTKGLIAEFRLENFHALLEEQQTPLC